MAVNEALVCTSILPVKVFADDPGEALIVPKTVALIVSAVEVERRTMGVAETGWDAS
jgi:hypothetical protein